MKTNPNQKPNDDHLQEVLRALEQLHVKNDLDDDEVDQPVVESSAKTAVFSDDRVEKGIDTKRSKAIGSDPGVGYSKSTLDPNASPQKTRLKSSTATTSVPKWRKQLRAILRTGVVSPKELVSLMKLPPEKWKIDFSKRGSKLFDVRQNMGRGLSRSQYAAAQLILGLAQQFNHIFNSDPSRSYGHFARSQPGGCAREDLFKRWEGMRQVEGSEIKFACGIHLGTNFYVNVNTTGNRRLEFAEMTLSQLKKVAGGRLVYDALVVLKDELDAMGYIATFQPTSLRPEGIGLYLNLRSPEYTLAMFGKDKLTTDERKWLRSKDISIDAK